MAPTTAPALTPVPPQSSVPADEGSEETAPAKPTITDEQSPATAPTTSSPPPPPSVPVETDDTLPPPADPPRTPIDPFFGSTNAAFELLADGATGASLTVVSGGQIVFGRAAGTTIDGTAATSDSPMVIASVSKLIVAVAIARLDELGLVDVAAPVPWVDLGLAPHLGWLNVGVRELLDHRGGLAKSRTSWFTGEGTCRDHIPSQLAAPPNADRGRWVYSNGNYCLLGLLVEQRTGLALDEAVQQLVFDAVGVTGVHSSEDGLAPDDLPYTPGVARLSRLGGAGTLIASTDDVAMVFGRLTPNDLAVLQAPGVHIDQYGFGHTGTVEFAKSCVWLFDGGTTVVSATVAGGPISSGGGVCDIVVPALATDLGVHQGRPDRIP